MRRRIRKSDNEAVVGYLPQDTRYRQFGWQTLSLLSTPNVILVKAKSRYNRSFSACLLD